MEANDADISQPMICFFSLFEKNAIRIESDVTKLSEVCNV